MHLQQSTVLHRVIAVLTSIALLMTAVPTVALFAQAVPPVLILPIDRATFLPGVAFDFRVEVHAEEMPADLTITINGQPAADFFGAEGTAENWTFGDEAAPTPAQSLVWRGVSLPNAGQFVVQVKMGDTVLKTVNWLAHAPRPSAGAQNVILFIADGMTVPMVTAARVVSRGNIEGKYNGDLTIDQLEEVGLVHTSGMDSIMTDSANSASAYNTGHKSAVNGLGIYPDTSPDTLDDPKQETFAELVKRTRGMAVGIVTTAEWQDATPAAVFAHTRRRADYPYIAAAPLDSGLLPEVIMGGGARALLPQSAEGSRREDDRDLFAEYEAAGYTIATTATELNAAFAEGTPERVLGVFNPGNMNVWLDRNVYTDTLKDFTDQPGLVDMTVAALDVLSQNENGFFLEVEAASVDKQMHPLDQERALADIIEFDNAIAAAQEWVAQYAPNTLIVVTADHGHGYDVYGTVDTVEFNAAADDAGKRDAIKLYNEAGFPDYKDLDGDHFPDTWVVTRTLAGAVNNHPDYTEDFQVSTTPRVPAIVNEAGVAVDNPDDDATGITMTGNLPMDASSGVHTLQDVPVYASGPGAAFFGRVIDNTEIFFGMAFALGLDPLAESGLSETGALAITHGVASGDVSAESAIVWSRANQAALMVVEYATDEAMSDAQMVMAQATAKTDYTAQVTLEGLTAGTQYFYEVWFMTAAEETETVAGTFTTAPAADAGTPVSFVLLGDIAGQQYCRHAEHGYKMFSQMVALEPDFAVGNGDMIYADGDCPPVGATNGFANVPGDFPAVNNPAVDWTDMSLLRNVYWSHYKYNYADEHYQALHAAMPIYSQWDDHEVINDFGAGPGWDRWHKQALNRPGFRNLVEAGRDAMFHYSPMTRNADEPNRIYRQFNRGAEMDLFIVDARSYRSLNELEDSEENAKTMLGAAQLQWLKDGLVNSTATWKVISLDLPLSISTGGAADVRGRDGFANGLLDDYSAKTGFERELLDLMSHLDANNVENVVVVVMDVHFAMTIKYEFDADGDGDNLLFHEFVSGPNNAVFVPPPTEVDPTMSPTMLYSVGDIFNFGYYRIEDIDGQMVFVGDIRDEDGNVLEGSEVVVTPAANE